MARLSRKQAKLLEPAPDQRDTVYSIQGAGGVQLVCHISPLAWTSRQWQWGHLIDDAFREGTAITIPADQFRNDRRVKDTCRAVWRDGVVVREAARQYLCPGGTVVVLESPHKDEYSKDGNFEPLIPLNATLSTRRFFQFLGPIFRVIEAQGGTVPEGDVILCNPIQWQTSLHRITRTRFLVSEIRDEVWSQVWSIRAVQAHFEARLRSYQPGLIINACTGYVEHGLKKAVQQTIDRLLDDGVLNCDTAATHHPSVWSDQTPLTTVLLPQATHRRAGGGAAGGGQEEGSARGRRPG